jgi:hypothetical protein
MKTMKALSSDTKNTSKRQRRRLWLGCFTILLASPLLLYYGYCWGIWGRQNLLLQYIFQCNCPPASEEARYPNSVDVIVSACRNAKISTRLSPSGRFLYLREEKKGTALAYLLSLQTMEEIDVTNQPFSSFLTEDLWFVESGLENYILDRASGVQYPIHEFVYLYPGAQINGETNLSLLAENLRKAEDVFLIGASTDTVVALVSDFQESPERNFIVDRFDIPGFNIEQFLQENNISYQTIRPDFPDEAVSPDGKFIARPDGIYLVETGQKIVEGYSASRSYRAYSRKYFSVRGWTSDGDGVVYSKFLNPCLIETNFFVFDDPGCSIEVFQPVIKLKVPEEYLLPGDTP